MIADFFLNLYQGVLVAFPILSLPTGFLEGLGFLVRIIGYINLFLPLVRLAPIVGLIITIRNWNILIALLRFVLRFIPFLSGG